ncbi:MAG: restriction endonuclease subunit S [Arcobacteraceae bacterium]|nr:restriction endonuclease subunit S [Arcobacteraceae bacterium]
MSSWRECKLGDVAKLSKKSWKVGDEQMPYIGLEHIEEAKLRLNDIGKSDDVASNKFRFQAGDTLFGKLRPYFRKVVKPNFDGICSTDIWVINPQKGIDKDFIFYFFANKELVDISYSASGGTRMPRADWDFLSQTVWNIPPLEEQKAIAEVLSSLDDKIDLLHRQNQTLESLAQTLFRQWFIEEAKEEWEEGTVGDIAILKSGKSRPKEESEINNIPIYGGNGILGFTNQHNIDGETIIIGRVGAYCGSLYMENKPIWVSDNALIAKPKNALYSKYLFYLLKENELNSMAEGSSHPLLTQEPIKSIQIFVPPELKLIEFNEQVNTWYEKTNENKKQIKTLENLRDTLLPKLLSGEVKINLGKLK